MSSRIPSAIPLTREELVKLKHQIEPNDYLMVESGRDKILVVRTAREFPDIVNDLDCMINKLDIRDTNELSHALIIGEDEVVGVPIDAIDSLIVTIILFLGCSGIIWNSFRYYFFKLFSKILQSQPLQYKP